MRLRKKIILLISFSFSFMLVLILIFSQTIVKSGFENVEQYGATENIERVKTSFERQIENINVKINDWSIWDDAYTYIQDGNKDFEKSTLPKETLAVLKVDMFFWRKLDGEILWGKIRNPEGGEDLPMPQSIIDFFNSKPELYIYKNEEDVKSGIIDIPEFGPSFVTVQPIIPSNGKGKIMGTMVSSIAINTKMIELLSSINRVKLTLKTIPEAPKEIHFKDAIPHLKSPEDNYIELISDNEIIATSLFKDIFQKPIFYIQSSTPRIIHQQSNKTIYSTLAILAFLSLLCGVSIVLILEKSVIFRINHLFKNVQKIQSKLALNQRVDVLGVDEIGALAQSINDMLSELERINRTMLHTSRLASLGDMSAKIAHEINAPLAIISGTITLLERYINNPVKFAEKIAPIQKSVEQIKKIVNGLQKFSKTSAAIDYKTENLSQLVKGCLFMVDAKASSARVQIHFKSESKSNILCNDMEIEQVVINLVSNAIDAVQNLKDKWVNVSVFDRSHFVVLQVIDAGNGIPQETLDKLFTPFFTTKAAGGGTGLGLAIVKGILDLHKATIVVIESSPHTCFEICFPKA